jgi:hypothetical protein
VFELAASDRDPADLVEGPRANFHFKIGGVMALENADLPVREIDPGRFLTPQLTRVIFIHCRIIQPDSA